MLILGVMTLFARVNVRVSSSGTVRFVYANPLNTRRIPRLLVFSDVQFLSDGKNGSVDVHCRDGIEYMPIVFGQVPQKERCAMIAYANFMLKK